MQQRLNVNFFIRPVFFVTWFTDKAVLGELAVRKAVILKLLINKATDWN